MDLVGPQRSDSLMDVTVSLTWGKVGQVGGSGRHAERSLVGRRGDDRDTRFPGSDDDRSPGVGAAVVGAGQRQGDGVGLVAPNGLLNELTANVGETVLGVEMGEHLGYEKRQAEGREGGDSRNG
jgi:hypothetical protein